MTVESKSTDFTPKFSYYVLEEKPELINRAKMVASAVANVFIYIANFFYEHGKEIYEYFLKDPVKVEEVDKPAPEMPTPPPVEESKKVKTPIVASTERRVEGEPYINSRGKRVCDGGNSLPVVEEGPLQQAVNKCKLGGKDLEGAAAGYEADVDSLLPEGFNKFPAFTPADVVLLKEYRVSSEKQEFIKESKEKSGKNPTEAEINEVFNEKMLANINATTESLLNEPEHIKAFKGVLAAIKESRLSFKDDPKAGVFGLALGAGLAYSGSQIVSVASEMILSYPTTALVASMSAVAFACFYNPSRYERAKVALESIKNTKGAAIGAAIGATALYFGVRKVPVELKVEDGVCLATESPTAGGTFLGSIAKNVVTDLVIKKVKDAVFEKASKVVPLSKTVFEKNYGISKLSIMGYGLLTAVGLSSTIAAPLTAAVAAKFAGVI